MTIEEARECAKQVVAKKYKIGTTLVMGHREKYWNEAVDKAITLYHTSQSEKETDAVECNHPPKFHMSDEGGFLFCDNCGKDISTKKQ